jgi:hypothetical protein
VTYSLLFGDSPNVLVPIAALGAVSVAAIVVVYRPLLLASALRRSPTREASAPVAWCCAS